MFDIFKGSLEDAKTLLNLAVGVIATWFVIWTWIRTRSIVPVVGSVLLGAVVTFGVFRMADLRTAVEDDVSDYRENDGAGHGG